MRSLLVGLFVLVSCGKSATAPDSAAPGADTGKPPAPDTEKAPEPDTGKDAAIDVEPDPPPLAWTLTKPVAIPYATATTGVCIPKLMEGYGGLRLMKTAGRKLDLCRTVDDETRIECYALDVGSGRIAKAKVSKETRGELSSVPAPRLPKELKLTKNGAEVCADACVPINLQGLDAAQAGLVGGRLFVAPSMNSPEGPRAVRVYDAKTGAALWSQTFEALGSECPSFWPAGELIYGELGVCAGPGARGVFYDAGSGRTMGLLGGQNESASAYGTVPVTLPSGLVAVREQYGLAIFFHDGKTGALKSQMNLHTSLIARGATEPEMSAEEGWMTGVPKDGGGVELVVGQGGSVRHRVLIVDPDALVVTRRFGIAACK